MKYTVAELFAGVGGFRIALERSGWQTIWANQWEPGRKVQYAADCYLYHFPDQVNNPNFNRNISDVTSDLMNNKNVIPTHDLLVGGFPCQDYSVATTKAKGMEGKKGVLWWEIERIVQKKQPPYILLENVDRLLVSPANQRGRDMAILLACLRDLGYSVEWRVINAADYSCPQKRRRVFIFASRDDTKYSKRLKKAGISHRWLQNDGFFATPFPVKKETVDHDMPDSFNHAVQWISDNFTMKLHNAGVMSDRKIYTLKVQPEREAPVPLSSILQKSVDDSFKIDKDTIDGWKYVKGAKRVERTAKNGHLYHYAEGAIPFPENLDGPARTILTSEGNRNPNRSTHLILDPVTNQYRTLTPFEVERLNGFNGNWTEKPGMPQTKRYFCMGNALVVDIVARMGRRLRDIIES